MLKGRDLEGEGSIPEDVNLHKYPKSTRLSPDHRC